MANDDKFLVTHTWRAIEANGSPITNGTFTIFARSDNRVEILKSSDAPEQEVFGAAFLSEKKEKMTYSLTNMENLYAKTGHGTAFLGIIEEKTE